MNNRVKFYRVEHIYTTYQPEKSDQYPVGAGPYFILSWMKRNKTLDQFQPWVRLHELLIRNEPPSLNPKKRRLANIGLFATFIDKRPGPKEDPYLRNIVKVETMMMDNSYVYGFDSIDQLNKWFDDEEERHQLDECGFSIGEYYVKKMTRGLRQSVVMKDDVIYKIRNITLVGNGLVSRASNAT